MVAHIDKDLLANPNQTWERLGWRPRGRLLVCRRLPFMLEHRKTDAVEWNHRNEAAMKEPWVRPNLVIHKLLQRHMETIRQESLMQLKESKGPNDFESYHQISGDVLDWRVTVTYRHILNAIRTNEKGLFTDFCKDLAVKRHGEGFSAEEVCRALRLIQSNILKIVGSDPDAKTLMPPLNRLLGTTVEFGCDQIMETYEELGAEVPDDFSCEDPFLKYDRFFD
jgi:hypothetical protein